MVPFGNKYCRVIYFEVAHISVSSSHFWEFIFVFSLSSGEFSFLLQLRVPSNMAGRFPFQSTSVVSEVWVWAYSHVFESPWWDVLIDIGVCVSVGRLNTSLKTTLKGNAAQVFSDIAISLLLNRKNVDLYLQLRGIKMSGSDFFSKKVKEMRSK